MSQPYAIVIPAYNEARTIRRLAEECLQQGSMVIIVDDGSSDGTADQLAGLPLVLLRNPRNLGKAATLWRGMEEALARGAQGVITLDGDGQHFPADIPRFLQAWEQYPRHIIIGSRLADKAAFPPKRYYANRFANFWIAWAAGYPIEDSQSGFRLYPADLLRKVNLQREREHSFVFESEILIAGAHLGFPSHAIPIAAIYEIGARPSHFSSVKDILLITRMVARYLITGGLRLPGLYRSAIRPYFFSRERVSAICGDGWSMLLLSLLVATATLGVSLIWTWGLVRHRARHAVAPVVSAGDCALVMAMRLRNGAVGADYRLRLQRAAALPAGVRLILLGGHTTPGPLSEAEAGARYLQQLGVARERMILEDRSRHTLENLQQARQLLRDLGCQQPLLISNRYHLARCHYMAQGLELEVRLCPAEDRWPGGWRSMLLLLRETFFLHWYLTGRVWGRLSANERIQKKIT